MISPDQHLAHFIATCGNTSGNDALLLRQLPQSLGGSAFEWYYSLENGSIKSWDDMIDAFRAKFAVASDRVGIADLASTKPKKGEPFLEYINRWRNLSIRCERSIEQSEAVDLLLKNIDNWMMPFLGIAKISTFQDFITCVSTLEKASHTAGPSSQGSKMRREQGDGRKAETKKVKTSVRKGGWK